MGNFLHFSIDGYGIETEHLQRDNQQYRKTIAMQVIALSRQGMSIRKIATEVNLSASMVNRMIKVNNNY